jgi:hypothetical protein
MDGNLVLAHYNNYDKCLDPKSRKRLTNCIVEHFFKEGAAMGQDDFKSCADKIVELFPSEKDSYDLYYIAPEEGHKQPRGKLKDRYHNFAADIRKTQKNYRKVATRHEDDTSEKIHMT